MNYTIRKGILIKANQRFVWNILCDFQNKYFSHIACLNSSKNNRPSALVDNEFIVWKAKQSGDIELDRYKDVELNRKIQSVVYHLRSSGKSTWVEINVEMDFSLRRLNHEFAERCILKNVISDNLVWLKTLIEDRFDQIYDNNLFVNNKLDNSYNAIIRVAREASYLPRIPAGTRMCEPAKILA